MSVVVYHEPLSLRKAAYLLLIVASLVLLWWDRKQDLGKGGRPEMVTIDVPIGEVE